MNTAALRDLVFQECQRPENLLGPSFFDQHLAVVDDYGTRLAGHLGADLKVVEIAAYLHDISAVRDIATLPQHAALSAEIGRELLNGNPPDLVDKVCRCIASHSTPIQIGGGSAEEIAVSNADAMAQILRPAYWLFFSFAVRKLNFEEGRQWLLGRIESNWNSLIDPAKELVQDGYRFAERLLR